MAKKYEIGQVIGGVTIIGTVPDEKYNKYLLRCNTCGTEFVEYSTAVKKHQNGCYQCKRKLNVNLSFMDVMRDTGDYINTEKLLAEFFGIDLVEADKEKSMLLEVERNKTKPHHCKLCGVYIEKENLSVCDKCASEFRF